MKKLLILMSVPLLLLACKSNYPVAQESGSEDIAYLLFVSSDEYAGKDVQVTIDNASTFSAKVVKQRKSHTKGTQYGVKTGARSIVVSYKDNIIYKKKIFVSTQEVKQIILP